MNSLKLSTKIISTIALSLLSIFTPVKSQAAERIVFNYPPFGDFNVYIDDLEKLAERGVANSRLRYFTNRMSQEQLNKLEDLLSRKIEFNSKAIYYFTNSPIGETVLKNLGKAIKTTPKNNGFFALRAAINLSANSDEGLTLINFLRTFPAEKIYIDLDTALEYVEEGSQILRDKELIVNTIKDNVQKDTSGIEPDLGIIQKLQSYGNFSWKKETLDFQNPDRPNPSPFDLYLPYSDKQVPLVIISHGLASNRNSYVYLAEHLASHGFAVVALEHIDTNSDKFDALLSGLDRPPEPINLINRPRDIKYLLDKLEIELSSSINFQQVGAIGQSLGGYTVLGLAGANLNYEKLKSECVDDRRDNAFNMSVLLQCRANELPKENYEFKDERIKAIIAINPVNSIIYGQKGMSQIDIPTAIVSGEDDLITPPIPEQIYPFTWLENKDKYLVVVEKGTHFTFIEKGKGVLPIPKSLVGPDPSFAYPGMKFFSLAFFTTYLTDRSYYKNYLTPSYVKAVSQEPIQFDLIRSLTDSEIETTIKNKK